MVIPLMVTDMETAIITTDDVDNPEEGQVSEIEFLQLFHSCLHPQDSIS